MSEIATHFQIADDQANWSPLFDGYAEFYITGMDRTATAVWGCSTLRMCWTGCWFVTLRVTLSACSSSKPARDV